MNDAHIGIFEECKETLGQVETTLRTVLALVDYLSLGSLAVVGYGDFFVTVRAVVPFWDIERHDKIAVGVCSTTGSKSSVIERKGLVPSVGIACAFVMGVNVVGSKDGQSK